MGRQKKLIEKEVHRMVTFSRRRSTLFKKASELSIFCGVRVGIVGFTPTGKLFSFGCPSMEVVMNEFHHKGHEASGRVHGDPSNNIKIYQMNKELEDLMKQLQLEKEKKGKIEGKVPLAIADLKLEGLQKLKVSLKDLCDNLNLKLFIEEEAAASLLLLAKKPIKFVK